MSRRPGGIGLLAVVVGVVGGCNPLETPSIAALSLGKTVLVPPPIGRSFPPFDPEDLDEPPITREQADDFGRALGRAMGDEDHQAINETFLDWDRIVWRACLGLGADPWFILGMAERYRHPRAGQRNFALNLSTRDDDDAPPTVLQTRWIDGRWHCLVRSGRDGYNYHDLTLARGDRGRVVAVDDHLLFQGMGLSEFYRYDLAVRLTNLRRDDGAGLPPDLAAYARAAPTIGEAVKAMDDQRYLEGSRLLAGLSPTVQAMKPVRFLKLVSCEADDPPEVRAEKLRANDEFREAFPEQPSADLVSLDAHLEREEFPALFEAIARIRTRVGEDPALDEMAAASKILEAKDDEALAITDRLIKNHPQRAKAYRLRVGIRLSRRDYPAVVREFDGYRAIVGEDPVLDEDEEIHRDFLRSPDYLARAARLARERPTPEPTEPQHPPEGSAPADPPRP